jgi:hypothetical protein
MIATTTLPGIVRGEHRSIKIRLPTPPTTAEQQGVYRLGFSRGRDGADLLTIDFGPSEYVSGEQCWLVALTPTQTLLLPVGEVYLDVWDRASNARKAMAATSITVGNLAGRPG